MKQVFHLIFLLIFFLKTTALLAFQQPLKVIEKYGSIEQATSKMEEYAYAEEFAEAINIGVLIREQHRQQKDLRKLNFINQELLLFQVLRTDIEADQKEKNILQFCKDSKANNDPHLEQICQAALAHLMVYSGQIERFQPYYDKAIKVATEQNDYSTIRTLNVNIATEYLLLAEWKDARMYIVRAEEALKSEKVEPTPTELGSFHNASSVIYYNTSEYDKALNSALFNVRSLEQNQDDNAVALLYDYNNLASIYTDLGEDENAFVYHKKSLEILPKTNEYPIVEQAVLYYNISAAYDYINSTEESMSYTRKALDILSNIEDKEDFNAINTYIFCYHNLADLHIKNDNVDSAKYYLDKVRPLIASSPISLTDHCKYEALIALRRGDYASAIKYTNKSQQEAIKNYGLKDIRYFDGFMNYIDISFRKKDYQKALVHAQKALEVLSIDFSDAEGYTNPTIHNVIHKKPATTALQCKIQALTELYQQNQSQEIAQAIFSTTRFATQVLEHLSKEFKNPATKRRWLQSQAIPLFEAAIGAAVNIARITGNDKYLQEAFELSERSKSMLMTDMLQEQQAAATGGVPDSLVDQLQALKRALHVAEKKRFDAIAAQDAPSQKEAEDRIFKINQSLDILKRRFEKDYPKYYKLKYDDTQVSLGDIQAALEPNSLLLEYFEGEDDIYIFSVYKNRLEVTSFERTPTYNRLFNRFSESLIEVRRFIDEPVEVFNDFVTDSRALYQQLIGSVDLEGVQRLIIIPDGQLSTLPFEVLLTKEVPLIQDKERIIEANFSVLPYLLNDFSTNYNYSGRLWLERNALSRNAVNDRILALAPQYSGSELPDWRGQREVKLRHKLIDLPGAAEEVQHLSEHYAGAFFTGYEANEALLKKEAANYGILHLAMHGLVNTKNPEFSGLALAEDQSQQEDNFLYAYEIEQLPIQSSLIVLSACETGIGRIQPGEGVVSIGRSFVYAGAPSLLMTLWKLNDQSGAFIIEAFYKNLNQGLEKDEAIRQAKQQYLATYPQEYAHPFLWAAFVQVGSYDSISIAAKNSWQHWLYLALSIIGIGAIFFLFYTKKQRES